VALIEYCCHSGILGPNFVSVIKVFIGSWTYSFDYIELGSATLISEVVASLVGWGFACFKWIEGQVLTVRLAAPEAVDSLFWFVRETTKLCYWEVLLSHISCLDLFVFIWM
jgi:hypothetical protein